MPTEGGLHVPFIVQGPKKWVPDAGTVRNDLVDMLDLTATSLAWAGIDIPEWMEGRDLFADDFTPRTFVCGAKDRLDHPPSPLPVGSSAPAIGLSSISATSGRWHFYFADGRVVLGCQSPCRTPGTEHVSVGKWTFMRTSYSC